VQKAAAGVEEKMARDAADKNCLQIKPIFGKSVGITEKIIHIPLMISAEISGPGSEFGVVGERRQSGG
jgi:hypothetical protein